MTQSYLDGIIGIKRQIAKAIDMDIMFITECFIEYDDVVFTILGEEQFVAEWKDGIVISSTIKHINTFEPIEDIIF